MGPPIRFSIGDQKCWFCLIKVMVFLGGGGAGDRGRLHVLGGGGGRDVY